jgi:hypothetical protein
MTWRRYIYIVLGRDKFYFIKNTLILPKRFSETDINMLECLIDNIFVMFGERVFQQIVGIPKGTNCAPLYRWYNSKFVDFVDRIYPIELEIKDTKDTASSASYLDLHIEINSECRLSAKL